MTGPRSVLRAALLGTALSFPAAARATDLAALETIYQRLHAAPELSHHESRTAAFVAGELRRAGFKVFEGLGKFERPEWRGHGLAAVPVRTKWPG